MTTTTLAFPESGAVGADGIRQFIRDAVDRAPNHDLLQRGLEGLRTDDELVCFLHRFLHFNDALAARVPFLAGSIHLHPELFMEAGEDEEFCRRRNAQVSAYIAEAANDEYRMSSGANLVHQQLSQRFFRGVLGHYGLRGSDFDRTHALPAAIARLLHEARTCFFEDTTLDTVGAAIGFHVGLEFYADQEFNLVDAYLRQHHPDLVAGLTSQSGDEPAPYLWLSLHTVVEMGHYRAGLAAVEDAIRFCVPREASARMEQRILEGLSAFAELQQRFYRSVLPC